MQIAQLIREDPEKVLINVKNNEGSTIAVGNIMEIDLDSGDGILVEECDAALTPLVAGVATEAATDGSYFLMQTYGYCATVLTASTITAGLAIAADTSGKVTTATATSAATNHLSICGAVIAVTDTNSAACFLRLM